MKRHSRGFNLLVLMVTITLLGIVLGFGVPTFRQFTRNNTVVVANNDLITALNLARSEALRRNRPVSVCASIDKEVCEEDPDWTQGWIAFIDEGGPGELDGDDEILQVWQPASSDLIFDADSAFIQFQPTGMTGSASTFDIRWEGCIGDRARHVAVMATGAITGNAEDCLS